MSKNTYLIILKTGIYLSLLSVFLVYNKFLFPYITSKQIYFNILIEILFVFWIAFILKYPEHRPKKNWMSFGLVSFFVVMLVSCFTGVDFNLSFWGDVERMLGFFHIIHFLAFYFIIISIMRKWSDWRLFFILSIICATLVSIHGITKVGFSTIGNKAYVAGYLIFNMYFAFLLFCNSFKKSNFKKIFPAAFYLFPVPVMFKSFKIADISGAYVGLAIGIFALLFLLGLFVKNKKTRNYFFAGFLALALIVGFLLANKNSEFLKGTAIGGVFKQLSSEKTSFQTRLISWRGGLKDFKNHPFQGTGYGNYAIVFDKYFEPTFYNYTRTATYFDRAHNNIIDIISTMGIFGLATYMSIFFALAFYLLRGLREEKIELYEFALISSLTVAYFIQNLAVFDSLVTYTAFMMMLGFVYWIVEIRGKDSSLEHQNQDNAKKGINEAPVLAFVGIIMLFVIYQYNINPIKMLKGTIRGQIAFAQRQTEAGIEEYKKALSYNTGLDRDSRASLIRVILSNQALLHSMDKAKAKEIIDYIISLGEANVAYNPQDSLMQMQLAQVLNIAISFATTDDELVDYMKRAHAASDASIKSSPGRVRAYFTKSQIFLTVGEIFNAIEVLKIATSLNDKYYDSFCYLGRLQIMAERYNQGYKSIDKCIDLGGVNLLVRADFVKKLITYFSASSTLDVPNLVKLYERLSKIESNNPKVFVDLAKIYAQTGDKEKAIVAAEKAAKIDPGLQTAVDGFVNQLK